MNKKEIMKPRTDEHLAAEEEFKSMIPEEKSFEQMYNDRVLELVSQGMSTREAKRKLNRDLQRLAKKEAKKRKTEKV